MHNSCANLAIVQCGVLFVTHFMYIAVDVRLEAYTILVVATIIVKLFAMHLQTELMRVDVETLSELSAGQTVCDVWHQSSKPKNVYVAQVSLQMHSAPYASPTTSLVHLTSNAAHFSLARLCMQFSLARCYCCGK